MITILSILIIILLILIIFPRCNREGFNTDIWAHDPYIIDNEFKPAVPVVKKIWRPKELDAIKIETRLPELIRQRYSYDDTEDKTCYPSLYNDYAVLKELPVAYKSPYHARIPKKLASTSLVYDISKNQEPTYVKEQNEKLSIDPKRDYNVYRSCSGSCLIPINSLVPNRVVGIDNYGNDLSVPHDPMSSLPANYADRSKTSVERLIAADLHKEYQDPIHGWLSWER